LCIPQDGRTHVPAANQYATAINAAISMLGLDGMIKLADMTSIRSARFRSAVAYVDHDGEHTFSSQGPAGQAARPATATRQGAWSPLWNIWIPPGASVPVSAMSDREYAEYFAAWRSRSVFIQLGDGSVPAASRQGDPAWPEQDSCRPPDAIPRGSPGSLPCVAAARPVSQTVAAEIRARYGRGLAIVGLTDHQRYY
jgi:hypothetical protein